MINTMTDVLKNAVDRAIDYEKMEYETGTILWAWDEVVQVAAATNHVNMFMFAIRHLNELGAYAEV